MERRIMLVGRMGKGKSATGNLIVGRNVFESETSWNSVTRNCSIHIFRGTNPALPENQDFMVIDTPGYFSTDTPFKDRSLEIQRYIFDNSSMPHAFLLIFSLDKGDKGTDLQDRDTLNMLWILFGEQVFEHCIVVFTHADAIRSDEEFSTYWQNDPLLKEIVEKCNGRVTRVENRNPSESNQLGQLLDLIDSVSKGGRFAYSNPQKRLHKQFLESLSAANDHNIPRLVEDLKNFLRTQKRIKVAKTVVLSLGIALIGVVAKLTKAKGASKTVTRIIPANKQVVHVVMKEGMDYTLAGITAANTGVVGALIATGVITRNTDIAVFGVAWGAFSALGALLISKI